MKNIFLILCSILFFSLFADAQTGIYIDPRLSEVYSHDYLTDLSENSPDEIRYLNWYLDNSYSIVDVEEGKMEGLPYLKYFDIRTSQIGEVVQDIDEQDFNILLYHIEINESRAVTYRVGNSGKILIVGSQKRLSEKYKKHVNYGN